MAAAVQNGKAPEPRYYSIQDLIAALEEIEALKETIVIDLVSWRHLACCVPESSRTWVKIDGVPHFGFRLWLMEYAQPLVIAAPCEKTLAPGAVDLSR